MFERPSQERKFYSRYQIMKYESARILEPQVVAAFEAYARARRKKS
jgi:hypothetical protein